MIGAAHISLGVDDNFVGVTDRVAEGLRPDDDVITIEQHCGRGRKLAVLVGDGDWFAMLVQVREARVSRAQVDAHGVCRKHGR